jgi:GNAT superfamily N-acetyltransferase
MEIRRADSEADFTGYAEVWNTVTPTYPTTVAETKQRLVQQPWRLYLVAEEDGRIVGSGFAGRWNSVERGYVVVCVLPEWRRQGIGSAVYEACRRHAVELGATGIWGRIAEQDSSSRLWAANRGFVEVERDVELVRELGEEAPATPLDGIEIREVAAEDYEAVYAVAVECWPDMATPEPMPAPPYEEWAQEELRGPVVFGAFDGERLVGYAALAARAAKPGVLDHGLTGVVRSHRGRGIAVALKETQLAWAAEHGYRRLVTNTQEGNEAMRGINEKLGYREEPAWIIVRRAV